MSVYVIAQLSITDRAAYGRYQERFMGVLKRFKGRLLAADEYPIVVEGTWDRDKVVLLSFPDEAPYREWAESPDYQEIAKDRKSRVHCHRSACEGYPRPGLVSRRSDSRYAGQPFSGAARMCEGKTAPGGRLILARFTAVLASGRRLRPEAHLHDAGAFLRTPAR